MESWLHFANLKSKSSGVLLNCCDYSYCSTCRHEHKKAVKRAWSARRNGTIAVKLVTKMLPGDFVKLSQSMKWKKSRWAILPHLDFQPSSQKENDIGIKTIRLRFQSRSKAPYKCPILPLSNSQAQGKATWHTYTLTVWISIAAITFSPSSSQNADKWHTVEESHLQ